jgi:hypothetical protein
MSVETVNITTASDQLTNLFHNHSAIFTKYENTDDVSVPLKGQ